MFIEITTFLCGSGDQFCTATNELLKGVPEDRPKHAAYM